MPGFFASNRKINIELENRYPQRCLREDLTAEGFTAKRHTLNRFLEDKTLCDTGDFILILDGILLNKSALFAKYAATDVAQLMEQMYRSQGDEFFTELRGGFSGALYEKSADKWLVFTNHAGDIPVYYALLPQGFCAGSQVNYVLDACREVGVALTLDETAVYQMLTYGFMIDDATYAQQIRRLRGGTYLRCVQGRTEVRTYFTYTKNPQRFAGCSEQQIIDAMDAAFLKAVRMEYEKDEEYGYGHLSDVSGGLDARMSLWAAHQLGYGPMQLLTYSKSGHPDETISKEIAEYWNDELLFKPLDDGSFFFDIDEIVFLNGGTSFYSGISGGNRLLRSINMDGYGLEHDGIFGGAVISSWYSKPSDAQNALPTGVFSGKLLHRVKQTQQKMYDHYGDHELFLWYTRGFQGMANTHQIRRNYTEASSPYMDVEFAQLCMDIPVELRMHHSIHKKWIINKYPAAGQIKWTGTGAKLTEKPLVGKIRAIVTRGPYKIMKLLGLHRYVTNVMVPMDYLLARLEKARTYLEAYAADAFAQPPVAISPELEADMKQLFHTGTGLEKTQVLTVLSALKLYFGN